MVILIDTREQAPLRFGLDSILTEARRATLKVGDYQALYKDGSLSETIFERKTIGDLWSTMASRQYQRFKREMVEAKEKGVNLIIIVENPFKDVENGYYRSRYDGQSMVKKLGTLYFKYGLPTVFTTGREEMARFIKSFFYAEGWHRKRKEREKKYDNKRG